MPERRDRRQSHRLDLDVGARLIGVDLQEHVADAEGRALVMGDDDLDLPHVGHRRRMTTDVAMGLSRAIRPFIGTVAACVLVRP